MQQGMFEKFPSVSDYSAAFIKRLHFQHQLFTQNQMAEKSLLSQIQTQFTRERLVGRWGLFFFDFDDTLYNATDCRRAKEYKNLYLYNGTSLKSWKKILLWLRHSGIKPILFFPNSNASSEDAQAQLKVFKNLKDFFSDVLFTQDLGSKGEIINYLWTHVTQTLGIAIPKNNLLYVSDDIDEVQAAEIFNIQTLLSLPGSGHSEESPYILALRGYALHIKRLLFDSRFATAAFSKQTSFSPGVLPPPVFPPIISVPLSHEEPESGSDSDPEVVESVSTGRQAPSVSSTVGTFNKLRGFFTRHIG